MWAERAREAPARPPLAAPAAMSVCITWRHAASLAFQHRVFINVFFCIYVAPTLRLLWMHTSSLFIALRAFFNACQGKRAKVRQMQLCVDAFRFAVR